jgi:uncharacterized protein DUF4345
MEGFVTYTLVVFGLFFLYTGVMSFWQPTVFARMLALETQGRSGQVEIRAQYGGFFCAAALSQFSPFIGVLSQSTALIVALVIFGGLIGGRLAALLMPQDENLATPIRALYWVDAAGAIGALLGLQFL